MGSSDPTLVFYFVRCVEALAVYIIMDEQLLSGNLAVITDDIIKPRIWDTINKNSKWKEIAGRKNVDRLFRDSFYSPRFLATSNSYLSYPKSLVL